MRVFFVSDTHFNHRNIIEYCDRPFYSVDQMNNTIIKRWNQMVSNEDKVYFLGDFAFGDFETIEKFTQSLNGRKTIVCGNHDRRPQVYIKAGFEEASSHPIIVQQFYILSHAPVFLNTTMPYINIHGHLHQREKILLNEDMKNLYYNVSVEQIGYTPINFEVIKKYYKVKT